jgi:hypothetical protein
MIAAVLLRLLYLFLRQVIWVTQSIKRPANPPWANISRTRARR